MTGLSAGVDLVFSLDCKCVSSVFCSGMVFEVVSADEIVGEEMFGMSDFSFITVLLDSYKRKILFNTISFATYFSKFLSVVLWHK